MSFCQSKCWEWKSIQISHSRIVPGLPANHGWERETAGEYAALIIGLNMTLAAETSLAVIVSSYKSYYNMHMIWKWLIRIPQGCDCFKRMAKICQESHNIVACSYYNIDRVAFLVVCCNRLLPCTESMPFDLTLVSSQYHFPGVPIPCNIGLVTCSWIRNFCLRSAP